MGETTEKRRLAISIFIDMAVGRKLFPNGDGSCWLAVCNLVVSKFDYVLGITFLFVGCKF